MTIVANDTSSDTSIAAKPSPKINAFHFISFGGASSRHSSPYVCYS
ncbi:hypothetical protein [Kurthia massiliensis]|nr:hypothetical protein [Kurthia massiliensis]